MNHPLPYGTRIKIKDDCKRHERKIAFTYAAHATRTGGHAYDCVSPGNGRVLFSRVYDDEIEGTSFVDASTTSAVLLHAARNPAIRTRAR